MPFLVYGGSVRDNIRHGVVMFMIILGGIGLLRLFEMGYYRDLVDAGIALATFLFTWWHAKQGE